jgi:hypothetical protein
VIHLVAPIILQFPPDYSWIGAVVSVAATVTLGLLGLRNTRRASRDATDAAAAAQRTMVEEERRTRMLDRRADLYSDLLRFISGRRQWRNSEYAIVKPANYTYPQTYDPVDQLDLEGRAEAIASKRVNELFSLANEHHGKMLVFDDIAKDMSMSPKDRHDCRTTRDKERGLADNADKALREIVREELGTAD